MQLARYWTFIDTCAEKECGMFFCTLTQLVSAPFNEDTKLTLRFLTVEVTASFLLPSFVPFASGDWNL